MRALDQAHAAMLASPDEDGPRLRYFALLADAELLLLLEREAAEIAPRLFDLDEGPVVLAFDSEERLAEFAGEAVPCAALPGRVIAAQLAGRGIGLGINLGAGAGEFLMPPEAVDWLVGMLDQTPTLATALPEEVRPPGDLPPGLARLLADKLAPAAGLASGAALVGVTWAGGRRGHLLAILGAAPGVQEALARAVAEALAFSGLEAGQIDVAFLPATDPGALRIRDCGLWIPMEAAPPARPPASAPRAPGSDPDRPPILR